MLVSKVRAMTKHRSVSTGGQASFLVPGRRYIGLGARENLAPPKSRDLSPLRLFLLDFKAATQPSPADDAEASCCLAGEYTLLPRTVFYQTEIPCQRLNSSDPKKWYGSVPQPSLQGQARACARAQVARPRLAMASSRSAQDTFR